MDNRGDGGKRKRDEDDDSREKKKPYSVREVPGKHIFGKKFMRRYKKGMATDSVYDVSIGNAWQGQRLVHLTAELTRMWRDVLNAVREDGALATDLVRIHIAHRDLKKGDIKIPLQRLEEITPGAIMERIATVLQSHDQLKADNILEISVGLIKFPRGQGWKALNITNLGDLSNSGKRSLTYVQNQDDKCLAHAIAISEAWTQYKEQNSDSKKTYKGRKKWLAFIADGNDEQTRRADEIIELAGLTGAEYTSVASLPRYEKAVAANIVVISSTHGNGVIYPKALSPDYDKTYYIYHVKGDDDATGHFHSVKSPTGLMAVKYFCDRCLQGYPHKHKHHCQGVCSQCKADDCSVGDAPRSCRKCHIEFRSAACFNNHLKKEKKSKTVCEKFWQCRQCRRSYETATVKEKDHRCGQYYCKVCERQVVVEGHHCYQRALKEAKTCQKFIFFDFESNQETGEHVPNLVVARRYDLKKGEASYTEEYFRADDVRQIFGAWLFSKENKGYTVIAHNMKGYDGMFLLNYLVKNAVKHEVIFQGSKIMSIKVQSGLTMRVIDSLNFFPMPLSKLPKTFGLDGDVKKGDFPHQFNVKKNYGYVGKTPALRYYDVDKYNSKDREQFIAWHSSVRDQWFDFEKELLDYCKNDVKILSEACLKFRKDFISITELDPFTNITIASATMAVFKRNFLPERYEVVTREEKEVADSEHRDPVSEHRTMTGNQSKENFARFKFIDSDIGIVPSTGYTARDNFSFISIAWLKWMEHKDPSKKIQHGLSPEGEFKVPNTVYRVDGYDANSRTVYEFNGCLYHGCSECYQDETLTIPKTGETRKVLYTKTVKKERDLKALGYKVVTVWEHEFKNQISEDDELRDFVARLDLESRLDPRDSFFGGRTNACRLYYETAPDETVRYADFTSLYPYVNKYARYPVGHPQVITNNFAPIDEYFGIAKVKILPPEQLYHPVLPCTSNGKLKFPLCNRCAAIENQSPCSCSDEERCLTGTWCTPEIQKAVEVGYKILKIYEVYHWPKSCQHDPKVPGSGLFANFINTFLKIKQESSGWPEKCDTDEEKRDYISRYLQHEGIALDADKIVRNPGLRSLAKLILNSFWGKYGQRSNLKQTVNVYTQAQLLENLMDPHKLVDDFHILNEDTCMISYSMKSEFVSDCPTSNVVIASFTTCWARLKLYRVLEKLGRRCLYFDTDSVIFAEKNDDPDPVQLGDYLGDLTDELKPGNHITTFVGAGPKNYAYRESDGSETCKVRGFTLNHENSCLINYSTIQDLLLNHPKDLIVLPAKSRITRDKFTQRVLNREEARSYGLVYTKRRIIDNYDTLPFGYVDC